MWRLIILIVVAGCGPEHKSQRTTYVGCDPVIITETETEVVATEKVVEKEVVVEVTVEVDTPLYFVGTYCGRTVVEHAKVMYVVNGGLMPLTRHTTIQVGANCKIRYRGGKIWEKRQQP